MRVLVSSTILTGLVALGILLTVPGPEAVAQADPLAARDKLAIWRGEQPSNWLILPYRPSYILPFTVFDDPNDGVFSDASDGEREEELDDVEVKFQFSFLMPLWRDMPYLGADFMFGYTQVSFWQLYNEEESEPFRDTNYEPEGLLLFDTDIDLWGGFRNTAITFGFNHQSNGRGNEDLTRSWNRLVASFILERDNLVLGIKPWIRIGDDDENPNIDKYLGYGELRGVYTHEQNVFSGMVRNNLRADGNRGAVELGWSRPLSPYVRGFVQYFYGYGENLLDYDYENHRIGVGVMLNDWL